MDRKTPERSPDKSDTTRPDPTREQAPSADDRAAAGSEHEYDPVGMAGKKAGIVEEIEGDQKEEEQQKSAGRKA